MSVYLSSTTCYTSLKNHHGIYCKAMQREKQTRDEQINSSHRSMTSSIFGGIDPFDDPFFTRPFGSIFEPTIFDTHGSSDLNSNSSKGLVIEEIDTDNEEEEEEDQNSNSEVTDNNGKAPVIEHPDDEDGVKRDVHVSKNQNRFDGNGTQSKTHSISYKKVTYGGINGAYYTATTTRKSNNDGVVLEDSKEADKTTGQATHRISKGIHDKGHSVTRKLGTDGGVDTVQTLHNLNQDELASFEQEWEGNADMHIPKWNEEFNSFNRPGFGSMRPFGLALTGRSQSSGSRVSNDSRGQISSSRGQPKKVVRINID
ncbi:hypothetical protein LXL04_026829 [Taraxacum kok-saghyz]